ncbi:MAG: hypothetical protein PSV16_05935 [Flavobacterium sp.]|nr:hypothetical protein [Flavobacterium sp.]
MDRKAKIQARTKQEYWIKYKKPIIITTSVIVLQLIFGFDAKFCIINIIWLLV